MKKSSRFLLTIVLAVIYTGCGADGGNISGSSNVSEWKKQLNGAKLVYYNGSVISNNSSLTTIKLCSDSTYSYYFESGFYTGNGGGGASSDTSYGNWDVQESNGNIFLTYISESGERGSYTLSQEDSGHINMNGNSYAIERGGANC